MGTFIFFAANPLVLNSISLIGNLWFSDDERAKATAIAGLMAPMGALVGLAMTGALASGIDSTDPEICMNRFKLIVFV